MKVKSLHGYFIFEETKVGEVSAWMSITGLELVPRDHYYTFAAIAEAPEHSLAGKSLLGIPATKTFAGRPWEVFAANGFVYDFTVNAVRPISSITITTNVSIAGNRFTSPGLIQPGSVIPAGRVKDFAGWWNRETLRWLYSEVSCV